MNKNEKTKFAELVSDTMAMHGHQITKGQMAMWWEDLSAYSFDAVQSAFAQHRKTAKRKPIPADILEFLPDTFGHPAPEEAWNRLPKSDFDCGYVTDEMMAAASAADGSIQRGDHVAARMAFIESYRKQVAMARASGKRAKFWFSGSTEGSFEHRKQLEEMATIKAAELGWLEPEKALNRLEAICSDLGKSSDLHLQRLKKLPGGNALRIENGSKQIENQSKEISESLRLIKTDVPDEGAA